MVMTDLDFKIIVVIIKFDNYVYLMFLMKASVKVYRWAYLKIWLFFKASS
jgi:hypothetical protein